MGKYRPSNGSEGDWFMGQFCFQCSAFPDCEILGRTMAYNITDPEYPDEWQQDEEGAVTCTSFHDKKDDQPKPYRCEATADLFEEK